MLKRDARMWYPGNQGSGSGAKIRLAMLALFLVIVKEW